MICPFTVHDLCCWEVMHADVSTQTTTLRLEGSNGYMSLFLGATCLRSRLDVDYYVTACNGSGVLFRSRNILVVYIHKHQSVL